MPQAHGGCCCCIFLSSRKHLCSSFKASMQANRKTRQRVKHYFLCQWNTCEQHQRLCHSPGVPHPEPEKQFCSRQSGLGGTNGRQYNWQVFILMTCIPLITLLFKTHTRLLIKLLITAEQRPPQSVFVREVGCLSSILCPGLCHTACCGHSMHTPPPLPQPLSPQNTFRDKESIGLAMANGCLYKETSQA